MDVSPIANALNTDEDTARFLVGVLLTFPMGYLMSFIPFGVSKHTFAVVGGLYFLRMTMGDQWFHVPLTTILSYLMLWKLPPNVSRYVVPFFVMAYCSYAHIMRQFYSGSDVDFSCPQMMLTVKLYTIAWNLWDGHCIQQNRKLSRATENSRRVAIAELPSFIEFCGYCLNFATVLVGPAYEFHYYKNVCNGNYVIPYYNKFRRLPRRWMPVFVPLATSVFFAVYHGVLVGKYSVLNNPNLSVFGYFVAWSVFKAKFYFIWKYIESSHNLWFGGFDGHKWSISTNVDIVAIESAPNLSTFTRQWNEKTSHWLNRYVYQRHGGNPVVAYIVAAVWHGFYPGYYLMYATTVMGTMCERIARKRLTPVIGKYWWYKLGCKLSVHCCGAYGTTSFVLLDFAPSLALWQSQYFIGHILMIVFYIIVHFCFGVS
jgi:hypothetical protein